LGVLFLLLVVHAAYAAPEPLPSEEGLIIAVDISLSMRKKLPAVQHAALTLIDGLDVQRQYRVALVRFGTTANQVLDMTLDSEVQRGILRSAVQQLQITDQWTHYDELVNFLALKVPTFSTARVSALVYSDGECSPDPNSGKRCIDPQSIGTLVPFLDFNMYLVRITATPGAAQHTPTTATQTPSVQIIESNRKALTDVSQQILRRIQTPLPQSVPDPVPVEPQPQEASVSGTGVTTVLLALAVLAAVAIFGLPYWLWRFRPFVLTLSLDGRAFDVPIDSVPMTVRIGSTGDCDCVAPELENAFSIVVKRRAVHLEVPASWQLIRGEQDAMPRSDDGQTACYDLEMGTVVKLVTPSAEYWLTVDKRAHQPETQEDDTTMSESPLDLLGIR
jgi:hypothetical protein